MAGVGVNQAREDPCVEGAVRFTYAPCLATAASRRSELLPFASPLAGPFLRRCICTITCRNSAVTRVTLVCNVRSGPSEVA